MELAWNIALVLCAMLFIAFTFVVAFGAPFLPTLKDRVPDIIKVSSLQQGQTLLELGSGDGRVLLACAKQGINSIGYELNPILVVYSKVVTYKYRKQIKIVWGNYWTKKWPDADVIFVFLLQPYMQKLDNILLNRYLNGVKLVSFAFTIPEKKPSKEINGMYLYTYHKQLKKRSM